MMVLVLVLSILLVLQTAIQHTQPVDVFATQTGKSVEQVVGLPSSHELRYTPSHQQIRQLPLPDDTNDNYIHQTGPPFLPEEALPHAEIGADASRTHPTMPVHPTLIGVPQNPSPLQCRPAHNVAFIKTHKAGSSTVANILQRFGIAHNLNFALPNKPITSYGANYIVKPGQLFTPDRLLPFVSPDAQFNILWSHSIYNKTAFRSILPRDTLYFSILREPFQQFVSSFEYYGMARALSKINVSLDSIPNHNPISAFLQLPAFTRLHPKQYGYLRNKQAQDLGFGLQEFYQHDNMAAYIQELDKDFTSFMIMEFFDESLILLRHKLCWDMKDILYIPKNTNKHKPNRTFTEWDKKVYKSYSRVDHNLYQYFLTKFHEQVRKKPVEFLEEVTYFKDLLSQVAIHCPRLSPFVVPASKWNHQFMVTIEDCIHMKMSEMEGLKLLRKRYSEAVSALKRGRGEVR